MGNFYWKKFKRTRIRLTYWDYKSPGYYFVTINIRGSWPWFGLCKNGYMCLSAIGEIAWRYWKMIEELHEHVVVDEFIIMPDHMHGIIQILEHGNRPGSGVALQRRHKNYATKKSKKMSMISPEASSISSIIRSYKSQVTKEARKIDPAFKWQSRFYDRIIRSEVGLDNVRRYIKNNPKKWKH